MIDFVVDVVEKFVGVFGGCIIYRNDILFVFNFSVSFINCFVECVVLFLNEIYKIEFKFCVFNYSM